MKIDYLNPTALFQPAFFTHTTSVQGSGKLVFVSGQVSYDRDGFVVGKGEIREQCEQVFRSLTHALQAAGASWSDVVKMNGYMVDMTPASVNMFREIRARHLDPKRLPASTLIGIDHLVHDDLLIEVELVAAVGKKAKRAKAARAKKRGRKR